MILLNLDPIVISSLFIRLTFSVAVSVTEALSTASSYLITPVTPGALPVTVKYVTGIDSDTSLVDFVDLRITRPTIGAEYQITITNALFNGNGDQFSNQPGFFIAKLTKVDSVLGNIPQLYDRSVGSSISGLFEAIAISDEEIGGS